MYSKRTKIVATIGPSSCDLKVLRKLVKSGMNVARLNFSYGTHKEYIQYIKNIREASSKESEPVGILQDLSGPKVRIGDFAEDSITLIPKEHFILSTTPCVGSVKRVFVNYPYLHKEVHKGDIIMLDDGRRKLEVISIDGHDIITNIIVGGTIKGRRGVNIPGALRRVNAITKKDEDDLAFGLENHVDFVALSFVRSADDIKKLRSLILKQSPKNLPLIIAKIETIEAVKNLSEIIKESDGVMVARGDLAVEVKPENVPFLQRKIVQESISAGKPVIVATQMLESMIYVPTPTRAEVGDVASAILEGTDAIMLSQETATGKYPVEAVEMMTKISRNTEQHNQDYTQHCKHTEKDTDTVDVIGRAVTDASQTIGAKVIVALSDSGLTARMISRYRPAHTIIVFTPKKETVLQLTLSFACYPIAVSSFENLHNVIDESKHILIHKKIVHKGDTIIIATGIRLNKIGGTNMMIVQTL